MDDLTQILRRQIRRKAFGTISMNNLERNTMVSEYISWKFRGSSRKQTNILKCYSPGPFNRTNRTNFLIELIEHNRTIKVRLSSVIESNRTLTIFTKIIVRLAKYGTRYE